jgi:hypothetical protein|tara:strand:- start:4785 stop:5045 length:261 start_codon:yes stop_codon:yes gene_type:complete
MATGKKVNDVLEENFMTAAKFSLEIENIVKDGELNYIESIVMFCEEKNIEIENVNKLINKPLKEKVKYEAQKLNYIKKGSRGFLAL